MVLPLHSKKGRKANVLLCYVPANSIPHKLLKEVQTRIASKQARLSSSKYTLGVAWAITRLPTTRYATTKKLCALYGKRRLEAIYTDLETSPEPIPSIFSVKLDANLSIRDIIDDVIGTKYVLPEQILLPEYTVEYEWSYVYVAACESAYTDVNCLNVNEPTLSLYLKDLEKSDITEDTKYKHNIQLTVKLDRPIIDIKTTYKLILEQYPYTDTNSLTETFESSNTWLATLARYGTNTRFVTSITILPELGTYVDDILRYVITVEIQTGYGSVTLPVQGPSESTLHAKANFIYETMTEEHKSANFKAPYLTLPLTKQDACTLWPFLCKRIDDNDIIRLTIKAFVPPIPILQFVLTTDHSNQTYTVYSRTPRFIDYNMHIRVLSRLSRNKIYTIADTNILALTILKTHKPMYITYVVRPQSTLKQALIEAYRDVFAENFNEAKTPGAYIIENGTFDINNIGFLLAL